MTPERHAGSVGRTLRVALLALATLVVTAAPAAADAAGPTHYRSMVTGVEGPADAVDVEVLGGDAFVRLTVAEGSTATVPGYEGEPYLRFQPDGTVEVNTASPARWLNDARFGAAEVTVPPEASEDAPPRWEAVADGGTYAWHDHRVHWMSPQVPEQVDTGADTPQRVSTWEVELTVDDEPVVVTGALDWLPSPSPLVPGLVVLVALAAGVAVVWRAPGTAPLVGLVGAVAAGVVGVAASVGLPPGAEADPAQLVLPGVAVALALATLALRRRPGTGARLVGALVGLPVLVWAVLLARGLTTPVVPTALPGTVARALIALALGTGLVALVAAGRTLLAAGPPAAPRTTDPATTR